LAKARLSLGTLVAIEASAPSLSAAQAAVEAAFAAVAQIDRGMHPRSADSDLARITDAPLLTPVTVGPGTRALLNLARRLNKLTDGVFDPCLPSRTGRMNDIEVATDKVICHAPVALDFGGFAKGYAVDRAIEVLTEHGCTTGLVNAGGDLRVFGPRTEPIFLRGPGGDLTPVALTDAALAVSDVDSQRRPAEHQGYYGNTLVTRYAAVTAREAAIADALAKCVLLCPMTTSRRVLQAFGATRLGG
jgi:thiamine biosynthesis lipoprotein